ncbi:MAG: hypothetical protein ACJASI_002683 [Glaciecola sp.]|jgi:hypothetical protein
MTTLTDEFTALVGSDWADKNMATASKLSLYS